MPLPFDTDFFLGELPKGTFQEVVGRRLPKQQRRFFTNLFADIQDEYNQELVKFARANRGVSPTTRPNLSTFANFLEDFPFEEKFFERPFEERNPNFRQFNPRTRYLFPV